MRQRKHCFAGMALFILCLLLLAGCGSKEEEVPMGRYADREVKLPPGTFDYMHPCDDGSFWLYGTEADLTYVSAEGESKEHVFSWENSANIQYKYYVGASDSGAAVYAYIPKFFSDKEMEAYWISGDTRWMYYYVDEAGQKHALEPYGESYEKATNLNFFAFSPEEELYAASNSNVYSVDVASGKTEGVFATTDQVESIVFVDDVLLAADQEKAYFYDRKDGKLLPDNTVLNDFIASHSKGGLVMAVRDQVLYMACRTGLYRYVWDGTVVEQIADGQMTALGDTQRSPLALQVLDNEEFRILFTGNYMVEMYYDETLPARPDRELLVYSLKESGWIRYAGQLFQKEHPDVLVRYETGMEGDNAVSKEDALKNLNTRLLAGEGPDVLVLDEMDIEQYAEQGVLRELDDMLQPYLDDGILYRGIVEGMRMTDENKLYAVPTAVYLPMWLGEKMYLEGEDSLEDIVAGAELARQKHPEGPIFYTLYPKDVLLQTMPVCLPAWTKEDKSLDVARLKEYYQAALRLWELDCEGFSDEERAAWQKNNMEFYEPTDLDMADIGHDYQYTSFQNFGETWMQLGFLQGSWYEIPAIFLKDRNLAADWQRKELEDVAVHGNYVGQAENVYWAKNIVGLCEQAKEPELAESYMELLLSDEMMRRWWLEKPRKSGGITIRKDSLANVLDRNNTEFGQMMGWDNPGVLQKENLWPTEEEKQQIYQRMEDADTCYRPGSVLEECAMEVGIRVLEGELTPEEGADEVARKMAIELEE
ncbi:MAG: extracellular solute-binding protein [Eubacterium sp.]|nr:extracellular solute-binding protein [Eubacterium sp.]